MIEQMILSEELALPSRRLPAVGFHHRHTGPTGLWHGTEEQKERYLPDGGGAQSGTCPGFSEPGSGSDLASMETTAIRDGDDYVINGQI